MEIEVNWRQNGGASRAVGRMTCCLGLAGGIRIENADEICLLNFIPKLALVV